jgi:hypothetical protein
MTQTLYAHMNIIKKCDQLANKNMCWCCKIIFKQEQADLQKILPYVMKLRQPQISDLTLKPLVS